MLLMYRLRLFTYIIFSRKYALEIFILGSFIIFAALKGTPNENSFGEDPLEVISIREALYVNKVVYFLR